MRYLARAQRTSRDLIACLALCVAASVAAADGMEDHAAHHAMMAHPTPTSTSRVSYDVPAVSLRDETGEEVDLRQLLAEGRPIALNFIFTTCTTICPVMTATMLQFGRAVADDPHRPVMVSISIDPSYDSSDVLKAYAARYGAEWTFLTGSSADVLRVLRVFDAYRGSKVNHFALTLLRPSGAHEWTRVEGLTSAKELASIWQDISS
ncbi:MAG: SCO family protein [Steroidobacteraceae bacterium]